MSTQSTPKKPTLQDDLRLLNAARMVAAGWFPWFEPLLRNIRIIRTDEITTMCVTEDGRLFYAPSFLDDHRPNGTPNPRTLAFVLLHECLHLLLRTHARGKALQLSTPEDFSIWNEASDVAINDLLVTLKGREGATPIEAPAGKFPPLLPATFGFQTGQTAESYYTLLVEKYKKEGSGNKKPGPCAGCGVVGGGESSNDGQTPKSELKGSITVAKLSSIKAAVREGMKKASVGRGTQANGELLDLEAEEPAPRVDWRQHLAHCTRFCLEYKAGNTESAYTRMNKKSFEGMFDPILPGAVDPLPRIAIIADTSGSMYNSLTTVLAEAKAIVENIGPVTFIACDAEVHSQAVVGSKEDIVANMKGGGGTSMLPALEAAKKLGITTAVCITDGAIGPTGEYPGYHVIWCLVEDYKHDVQVSEAAGWGTVIECW